MDVIDTLLGIAREDPNIRAVLLNGSRACGEADAYSDYDIVFATVSNEPYLAGGDAGALDGALAVRLVGAFGRSPSPRRRTTAIPVSSSPSSSSSPAGCAWT